jgi:predicted PurR-regulated permease PerM
MPEMSRAQTRATGMTPAFVARRSLIASIVVLGAIALALALWKMRLAIFLLFGAIVIASAMRPGVEALHRRGVPRALGVAIHYVGVAAVVGALLWFAVPRALTETQRAIAHIPETRSEIHQEARQSHGLKHSFLIGLQRRLDELPTARELVDRAVELTRRAVEVVVGIFFLFASAAYWIFERERAEQIVVSLLPKRKREKARQTWDLIEARLGVFVRGQLILVLLVGTILSLAFWAIGLPYWLLVGVFAGVVELVPVLGPLAAGALAIGVGLTESPQVALAAGLVVLVVRLIEDYLVIPRLLGNAVGLSPLIVLVAVSATGILLGGLAVLLAIPMAALLVTLVDVLVLNKNPGEEEVPALVFGPKEG